MGNLILNKTMEFAVSIVKLCDELNNDKKYIIANQLLKSGTSIGANIREAQNSESRADFIHKFKIAAKEIKETEYWLELIDKCYHKYDLNEHKKLILEIAKITNRIITTMKNKRG